MSDKTEAGRQPAAAIPVAPRENPRSATEDRIDHALEDSFPASDPLASNIFD